MAAVKNLWPPGLAGHRRPWEPKLVEPWVQTPKWHWRYWIGHRMRQRVPKHYSQLFEDTYYVYRTYGDHARKVLEETCADDETKRTLQDERASHRGYHRFFGGRVR